MRPVTIIAGSLLLCAYVAPAQADNASTATKAQGNSYDAARIAVGPRIRISQTSDAPDTGSVCGTTSEGGVLHLTAPSGTLFTSVEFASYGTPSGSCGSLAIGSCSANTSQSVVASLAVGRSACDIPASNSTFGDPCPGTVKTLAVQLGYSPLLPDLRVDQPSGWVAPLVPRSDTLATAISCVAPVELFGDSTVTFVNWAVAADSVGPLPPWNYGVLVDGVRRATYPSTGATVSVDAGSVCGTIGEGGTLQLNAPAADVFTGVTFASYGTPVGSCGNLAVGACNASGSDSVVASLALGKNACAIPANNSTFGDPCFGTPKSLAVQLAYSLSGDIIMQNQGPLSVPGGWHTMEGIADVDSAVTESTKTNNVVQEQWLWRPHDIGRLQPTERVAPPLAGNLGHSNCDAVRVGRDPRYGWVIAIGGMASGDDYDLTAYDDYTGAQSGLSHVVALSQTRGPVTEFVAGTYLETPTLIYAAITRAADAGGAQPHWVDYSDARGRTSDGGPATWQDNLLASGRIADIFEAYLEAGSTWFILLKRQAGHSTPAFEVMGAGAGGCYGRGAAGLAGASVAYTDSVDTLRYIPTETGWHPIVVYRATQNVQDSVTYTLIIQTQGVLDVDGRPALPRSFELGAPTPNPSTGSCALRLAVPNARPGEVTVFDLSGRAIKRLEAGPLTAGVRELRWDGTDSQGRRVPSGIYLAQAKAGNWAATQKILVIK